MMHINCDIIQDLIPSYVEGISSDATKECVEEHVRECNQCRNLVEIYQDAQISNCRIEQKQIDGLKKFNNRMNLMNLFSGLMILLLIGLGTYTFCTNYTSLSPIIYYVLFPICIIGLYLFTGKKGNMKRAEKKDYIVATLSIVDTICAIGFMLYAINGAIRGKNIFSVEDAQLGPLIHNVWEILFLLLFIGFVYMFLRMIRNNINNKCIMCLQMIGIFLLLAYVSLLRNFTSIENFYSHFSQITFIIGTMGLAGIIVFEVISQK